MIATKQRCFSITFCVTLFNFPQQWIENEEFFTIWTLFCNFRKLIFSIFSLLIGVRLKTTTRGDETNLEQWIEKSAKNEGPALPAATASGAPREGLSGRCMREFRLHISLAFTDRQQGASLSIRDSCAGLLLSFQDRLFKSSLRKEEEEDRVYNCVDPVVLDQS